MSTDPTVEELLERNKYPFPIIHLFTHQKQADNTTKAIRRQRLASAPHHRALICRIDTAPHRHPSVPPSTRILPCLPANHPSSHVRGPALHPRTVPRPATSR